MSQEDVFQDRQSYYKGRAKIYLRHFQINDSGPRTIRDSHVDRLDRVFQSEGLSRLNPENYVKVSISNDVLQQALATQDENEAFLTGPLHFLNLPDEVRLNILHGNHRVLAAIRRSARWWVAEFYSDGKTFYLTLLSTIAHITKI
ncbi:hypothetical protein N7471_008347 [Penicillium samsonianum]|uniref:uncharacterized protein n=1 Tax=Penicillium samsonianum TaxID=1882272 RepID=UPI002548E734|nr:uncharacterized protein N7471_008347 [Penicillium samsonianum]KAJ6133132.1 hypothetical protein N7471_008347 [Penicillium samsonianum]